MRVCIIKMSSLGDVIHTLPAVTDAMQSIPDIAFDWIVEENFAEVPAWHPAVNTVIPIALRRWRKRPIRTWRNGEWRTFKAQLHHDYDLVIDAQGLLKSAWVSRFISAPTAGLDKSSIREPLAARCYQQHYPVSKEQHAVQRVRVLFAQALNYALPNTVADYGLSQASFPTLADKAGSMVFLHGTTRADKHWPEAYWLELCERLTLGGKTVLLPWGSAQEKQRAEKIAAVSEQAHVLPKMNLSELAGVLAQAEAVVAVDTGLGHLSAALNVPTISLYGSTDPELIGAYGQHQVHLQATQMPLIDAQVEPAIFAPLTPTIVFETLQSLWATEKSP